ncbi:MAG: FeoC-like transcriptional regulator [Alkalispirochaeta sp.]
MMVLQEVKRVLQRTGRSTLSQLVAETGADRAEVAGALQFFVDRGNVTREFESGSGVTCGTTVCKSCPLGDYCVANVGELNGLEVFAWHEKEK